MRIPKRFTLLGHNYTVHIVPRAKWEDFDTVGLFTPKDRAIHLLENDHSALEHSYLHELVHAVLLVIGKNDLYQDEAFVDLLSGLIHQALITAEY